MKRHLCAALCTIGAMLGLSVLAGFRQDPPFLVEIVVHDTSDPECIKVMEIWSDQTTVVRCIGPGERQDEKCAPSGHCTNNTLNCKVVSSPVGGATCNYCTAGTDNDLFCWPVKGIVCSTVPGATYTCGTRMQSTCVVPGGGGNATCTGLVTPANLGTCTLYGCA